MLQELAWAPGARHTHCHSGRCWVITQHIPVPFPGVHGQGNLWVAPTGSLYVQIQFPHDLQVFLVVIISGTKGGFYFQKEPIPQRCPFWQSSSSP